ncbi:MAG: extracellular solute-binding protein [Oscillospiraceae bacterium]|nr:extracellular solute-binding protein [Oscillospiraceae bacterium]
MRKQRQLFAILLACAMVFCLTACGSSGGSTAESVPASSADENAQASPVSAEEPQAQSEASVPEAEPEQAPADEAPAETEPDAVQEPEYAEVTYPIKGGYTLTMTYSPPPFMDSLLNGDPYTSLPTTAQFLEETGINVEYTMLERFNFEDKSSLMIASGDYPDILGAGFGGGYSHNSWDLVEDDIVVDLTDMLPEHAPDYLRFLDSDPEFFAEASTHGGRVVEIFGKDIPNAKMGMCIRKDWFDKLGLEIPSTVDDLTEALRVIHSEYNTGSTLLLNRELETGLYTTYGFIDNPQGNLNFQLDADGQVINLESSPQFIEYLTLLRGYFSEGIINDDFMSISRDLGNYDTTYLEGKAGVFQCGTDPLDKLNWVGSPDPDYEIIAIPDISLDGNNESHVGGISEARETEGYAISVSCEIPEVALEFLNYGFTETGAYLVNYGIEGLSYEYDENGVINYTELLTNNPDGLSLNFAKSYYAKVFMPSYTMERNAELKYNSQEELDAALEWASHRDNAWVLPSNLEYTDAEKDVLTSHESDLATLFAENMSKVITGDITVEQYREVIENANSMGLQACLDVYSAAYARYLEG